MSAGDFNFQVNLAGILDVLSNHLYKTPDVFVRELLQNGLDAITLRKKRQPDWDAGKIVVDVTPGRYLSFRDNGAGLDEQDIHRFLSVIGQSSKHDLESGFAPKDYLGRFGIGLLSCFMVSDTITVRTRKVGCEQGFEWVGHEDGTYSLAPKDGLDVGTVVILKAEPTSAHYYQSGKVTQLVRHFGLMLPVPVYVDDPTARVNDLPANISYASREGLLEFGNWLFEESFLDAIPLNTKHLTGVAFVLPYRTSQTARQSHRIYLQSMLLTESGEGLLPPWAFFLRCFLDVRDVRPTASREGFYEDAQLSAATEEFSQAVRAHLKGLSLTDPDRLRSIVGVHHEAIKSMAVWDDALFGIFIDFLMFETSEGMLSGTALKERPGAAYVSSVPKFKQMKPLLLSQGRLLICTGYTSDEALVTKLSDSCRLDFVPLSDDDLDSIMAEPTFDEWERTLALEAAADEALAPFECKARPKAFYPEELPALYAISEETKFLREVSRAQERGSSLFSDVLSSVLSGHETSTAATLYLNIGNPLVRRLEALADVSLVKSIVRILYIQALVANGQPLSTHEMATLNDELLFVVEASMQQGRSDEDAQP